MDCFLFGVGFGVGISLVVSFTGSKNARASSFVGIGSFNISFNNCCMVLMVVVPFCEVNVLFPSVFCLLVSLFLYDDIDLAFLFCFRCLCNLRCFALFAIFLCFLNLPVEVLFNTFGQFLIVCLVDLHDGHLIPLN